MDLIIFDVDGTLVDTATDVHICLNMALEKMNMPTITVETAKKAIGPGPKDFIKYILGGQIERAVEFHQTAVQRVLLFRQDAPANKVAH